MPPVAVTAISCWPVSLTRVLFGPCVPCFHFPVSSSLLPVPCSMQNQLSVESYIELHRALTKQTNTVQSVSPIEECFYKLNDLRQALQLHGYTTTKFKKSELFAALKGQELINPCSNDTSSSRSSAPSMHTGTTDSATVSKLPFTAADACSVLGATCSDALQPLKLLQLGAAAPFHAAADAEAGSAADLGPGATELPAPASAVAEGAGGVVCTLPTPPGFQASSATHTGGQQAQQPAQQQQQLVSQMPAQQQQQPAAPQLQQQGPQLQVPQLSVPQLSGLQTSLPTQGTAPTDPLRQLQATFLNQNSQSLLASTTQPQPTNAMAALLQQLLLAGAANTVSPAAGQGISMPDGTPDPAAAPATALHNPTQPQAQAPVARYTSTAQGPSSSTQQQHKLAGDAALADTDEPAHTPWLKPQLQWFVANGLSAARAAGAAAASSDAGGLLGRRVGFLLVEEMQVIGPRDILLTLPPGFYEGVAFKYLGSSCQSDVCESDCPGQHQFYRARILSPRALPEPASGTDAALAASLVQAHTATTGRPVLLILDLHPRLRAHSLESLLHISTPAQLQDAWLLLEGEQEASSPSADPHQQTQLTISVPTGKRDRDGGPGKAGATKRAKGRTTTRHA